ncbi:MAG: permease-like cell division protein FtsX [Bacteroidales bacterium]|nr:permease-like cell division protein FtsX [Bacteroidales bacterium]MBQ9311639.1 permease-like cell division protein FtsX [Bacteroidales bacterium]
MSDNKKYSKYRLFTANFSTVLSIALVLSLLAFVFLFSFHLWYLSNQVKESVSFTVYLNSSTSQEQALNIEKEIKKNKVVKSTKYNSVEDITKIMNNDFGAEHLDVLGDYNPYMPTIEVHLKAENMKVAQIKQFIRTIESKSDVEMVDYRDELINNINVAYYNTSGIVIIIFLCLLFISVTLINHTIALTIRNKKLLIRSMQLVGAKPSFIRRPFLIKGLWLGFIGGILADIFTSGVMLGIYSHITKPDLQPFYRTYVFLGLAIIVLGVVLSLLFSYIAVIRNMNLKNYKLYN